jgi:hypothetical protein
LSLGIDLKSKNALIIVESPLQLLCAHEAISYFKVNSRFYIRLSNNEVNNLQMKSIVKDLNIDNVEYLELAPKKDFKTLLKMFKYLIILKLKKYDYYILGDYLSGFIKQFIKISSQKKIILLDDGVASFKIQRELKKKSLPLTLYTMFNIEKFDNQQIYINKFVTLKNKYNNKNQSDDIFIGGKLVDLDIVSMNTYIKVIKHALTNSNGNKILYFPHRGTSKEVINEIVSIENIEVIYPDTTVELYLLKKGINPKNIYSILSTALFTLSTIYDNVNVIAYKPIFNKNDREDDIEKLYLIMEDIKNSIQIVSLNEDTRLNNE